MKLRLKYWLEDILRFSLRIFRIFPVKKKRILFSAFSGRQYSDSPKRISDRLLAQHPEYEQIWAFNEPENFAFLREKGIKTVKFKSLKYLYYTQTCGVFVDNVEFWSILGFRKNQMVLQTWHGGGCYKRVGSDRLDVGDAQRQHAIDKMGRNTHFVSSSKMFTEKVIRGAFAYQGRVLEVGLPRNDELMCAALPDENALRRQLHIPQGDKVVLYAPTFRNSLSVELYDIDLQKLRRSLADRFGGHWTVVLRLHYYMEKQAKEMAGGEGVVDATDYADMQHLLRLADVLVTDYSSSIWDFSLMKKPALLYVNDLKEYCTERNFYLPIEKWPFPRAAGNEELAAAIENFDEKTYLREVAAHHDLLGSTETGRATALVCEEIEKFVGGTV